MHSLAKATADELQLPFKSRVFKDHETFKDHKNTPELLYQIARQDFLYDLMGMIDLLWPLVLLQLRAQSLMCPGWKFHNWVDKASQQLEMFNKEVHKKVPAKCVCPYIAKHGKEILKKKYGKANLEDGWLIIGKSNSGSAPHDNNSEKSDSDDDEDSDNSDGNEDSDNSDDTNPQDVERKGPLVEPQFVWKMRQRTVKKNLQTSPHR
ncbi:Hypothetical predicted protein [Paramuricea clavata]|uniref:Uncharacterized protein n=1 Tax=Paramuricea clavata TaxID=317549 RepID=A0A6S7FJ83_PARCT|nr:Hypothetical predicted protein [Paramuricea clavata]